MAEERMKKNPNYKLPKFLEDEPIINDGLEFYLIAYFDLGTTRQVGFGMAPISYFSIRDYARDYGIESQDDFENFESYIRELEKVEFKIVERRQK
jgi:hypothetical protein